MIFLVQCNKQTMTRSLGFVLQKQTVLVMAIRKRGRTRTTTISNRGRQRTIVKDATITLLQCAPAVPLKMQTKGK